MPVFEELEEEIRELVSDYQALGEVVLAKQKIFEQVLSEKIHDEYPGPVYDLDTEAFHLFSRYALTCGAANTLIKNWMGQFGECIRYSGLVYFANDYTIAYGIPEIELHQDQQIQTIANNLEIIASIVRVKPMSIIVREYTDAANGRIGINYDFTSDKAVLFKEVDKKDYLIKDGTLIEMLEECAKMYWMKAAIGAANLADIGSSSLINASTWDGGL